MTIFLIIIILVFWAFNYVKFRRKNRYFNLMVGYLLHEVQLFPNWKTKLRLSSALIEIQHYKDAYQVLCDVAANNPDASDIDKIRQNITFCLHPIPGVSHPKNYNHSYWHNFILVRLGGRRYNFLEQEDFLRTNSIQRNI